METWLNPLLRRAIVVYKMGISLFLNAEQRKATGMSIFPINRVGGKTGLYVMGDIAYGGTLTDTGSGWIKSRIEKGDSAKDSEGGADDAE